MNTLKQRLTTNWTLMRTMRLGIGVMLLTAGIENKDWAMGLFSLFFLYQAVTDTGCCGSQGCYNPPGGRGTHPVDKAAGEEIEYEEVK